MLFFDERLLRKKYKNKTIRIYTIEKLHNIEVFIFLFYFPDMYFILFFEIFVRML